MTHDEIDQLKAGPELDELIVSRVMGHTQGDATWVPAYSTDIAAAITTLDLDTQDYVSLTWTEDGWMVDVSGCYGHGDTLPLAICRAALKAVA